MTVGHFMDIRTFILKRTFLNYSLMDILNIYQILVLLSYTAPVHFMTIMNPNGTKDNSFERARRAESNEFEINKFGQF